MKLVVNDDIHVSEIKTSDRAAYVEHLREKEICDRTLKIPFPYTVKEFRSWMEIVQRTTREHGRPIAWAIRNAENYLIGGCGLTGLTTGQAHRVEVGYWLAKPYWGRGIMTAVVRALCPFLFAEFDLVKITAHVFATNPASARVLEKCGFMQEGYLRKHYLKDGHYLDAKLYALFR